MSTRTELREPIIRNDSSSTISSIDAEVIVSQRLRGNQIENQVPPSTQSGLKVGNVCIDGSKTIQVGDQITYHIYPQAPGDNVVELKKENKTNKNNQNINSKIYRIWKNKCYCALVTIAILSLSVVIASTIVVFSKTSNEDNFTTNPSTQFTVTSTSTEWPTTSINTQETMTTSELTTLSVEFTSTSESTTKFPLFDFQLQIRSSWSAIAPRPGIKNLTLPIQRIILTHSSDQMSTCNTNIDCKERLKSMENHYNHLKDIPWNFMIGNDGNVYEGRGFNLEGEHTLNQYGSTFNDIGICIAFMGNFKTSQLTPKMIDIFQAFVNYALVEGFLTNQYLLLFQGQLIEMISPASSLYDQIKTVTNWHSISRVYDRNVWKAKSPCRNISVMTSIPERILLTHTGAETCVNLDECSQIIKSLQSNAMNSCKTSDFDDIVFNFIVGGNGDVFEGRGWNSIGEHSAGFNHYLGIAVIGNFETITPNEAIVQAVMKLLDDGMNLGKINTNYKVNGRSEFLSFGPGEAFMKIIQTWPHYEAVF